MADNSNGSGASKRKGSQNGIPSNGEQGQGGSVHSEGLCEAVSGQHLFGGSEAGSGGDANKDLGSPGELIPPGTPEQPPSDVWSILKRNIKHEGQDWGGADDPVSTRCPHLWKLLTKRTFPDIDAKREVGAIRIVATPNGFKATIYEFSVGYKTDVLCDALQTLWDDLERAIPDPKTVWVEMKDGEVAQLRKQLEREKLNKNIKLTPKPFI